MKINRRNFLGLAGATVAVGLTGKYALKLFGSNVADTSTSTKRYAMIVDLQKCQKYSALNNGCNQCILACNKIHNIPQYNNPKEEIKWIWKEEFKHAFIEQENHYLDEEIQTKPVLLLCNHCDNPPCTKVCPTQATWKREDGIVMMDWHRCIGCRYCMAACPYGSRSFNWKEPRDPENPKKYIKDLHDQFPTRTRGVVEKCTFCDERLAKNQLPACVEVCPANALIFGDINDPKNNQMREILEKYFTIRRKPELGTKPEVHYLI